MQQTHTPVVNYVYFTSKDQQDAAEAAVAYCDNVWPWWVHEVRVFCMGDSELNAEMSCDPEYRVVRIELYNRFFRLTQDEQAETLIHEALHSVLHPITMWVRERLIDPMKETNEELHKFVYDEFTVRFEGVVEDLAIKLASGKPAARGEITCRFAERVTGTRSRT